MTLPALLAWLAVATVLSGLLAAAAAAAHQLAARAIPARLVWAAALSSMLGVTASLPFRSSPTPVASASSSIAPIPRPTVASSQRSITSRLLTALRETPETAILGIAAGAQRLGQALPQRLHRVVLFAWPLTSALLATLLLVSYRRQRALLHQGTRHSLAGTTVYLSEQLGPAVIGIRQPRIVVPRWLILRNADEQQLVIAHESAHISARDPQLLLAGCLLVILIPWNPAAWYALAQLRLAIETDCDARLLARGTNTRQYGQLLIDLSAASHAPSIPLGAPAFATRATHLERRLRTMTARPARFLVARSLTSIALGAVTVLAACGAELPTAAELQGMDVAGVENRVGKAVRLDSGTVLYLVNGTQVSAVQARRISADSIATIEVRGRAKDKRAGREIRIVTKSSGTVAANGGDVTETVVVGKPSTPGAQPLFLIDGQKASKAEMDRLSPNAIASVEVIKGPTAVAQYGQDGANGVVKITTKR